MDLTLTEAWTMWWSGQQINTHTIHGISVLWASRVGKILTFLAGTTLVLDAIGPKRIQQWAASWKNNLEGEFSQEYAPGKSLRMPRLFTSRIISLSLCAYLFTFAVDHLSQHWLGKVFIGIPLAYLFLLVSFGVTNATLERFRVPETPRGLASLVAVAASWYLAYSIVIILPGSWLAVWAVALTLAFYPGWFWIPTLVAAPFILLEAFAFTAMGHPRMERAVRSVAVPVFFLGFGMDFLAS